MFPTELNAGKCTCVPVWYGCVMDPNNFDKSLDSVPKLLQIKIARSFDGDYRIARIIKFLFLLPNMTVQFYFCTRTVRGVLLVQCTCTNVQNLYTFFVRIIDFINFKNRYISDKLSVLWFFWSFFSSAKRSFLNHRVRIINSEIIEISWSPTTWPSRGSAERSADRSKGTNFIRVKILRYSKK